MLAEERRNSIVEKLKESGTVSSDALARSLGVSIETVRRDLRILESRRQLRRVHGGAVAAGTSTFVEEDFVTRSLSNSEGKLHIAHAVVGLLPENATVFFDLGTTTASIVAQIPRDYAGTIVTTSVHIATLLSHHENADVLLTGGRMRRGDLGLSGGATLRFLEDFYPDVAVISTGAVDSTVGVTDFEFEELQVKHLMLSHAKRSFVVADSSKFGKVAPYRVCALDEPTLLITDRNLMQSQRELLESDGAPLFLA